MEPTGLSSSEWAATQSWDPLGPGFGLISFSKVEGSSLLFQPLATNHTPGFPALEKPGGARRSVSDNQEAHPRLTGR